MGMNKQVDTNLQINAISSRRMKPLPIFYQMIYRAFYMHLTLAINTVS